MMKIACINCGYKMSGSEVAGHATGYSTLQLAKILLGVVATVAAAWAATVMTRGAGANGGLAGLASEWKIKCPNCKKTTWIPASNKKIAKE